MIHLLSGTELKQHELLAHSMFIDRARQFRDRLGWDVKVLENGEERDEYDLPHTLYVIAEDSDGSHAGSMRLLPTTSNTMISDHFAFIVPDASVTSPFIWECTRFCVSESASQKATALRLFGAGAQILERYELSGLVGVFDPLMERIYRKYGVSPEVLGEAKDNSRMGSIKLGLWHNDNLARALLEQRLEVEAADTLVQFPPSASNEMSLAGVQGLLATEQPHLAV
ncbi:MAG: acyl-homoserine-lactone synthase [Sulfitobacter sp.]